MKTILEVYQEYKIFNRLQEHMLRVAGVASLLCDNLDVPVNKDRIVEAALLHDMGNIVKSKLTHFSDFSEDELKYWESVKSEFINKYGEEDHKATNNILKELDVKDEVIKLTDKMQFDLWCDVKDGNDLEAQIMLYADGRVSPDGVLSYQARMDEAKGRYTQSSFQSEERDRLVACGLDVERKIFAQCRLKPEDITDEAIAPIIEKLRDFVIK